MSLKTAQGVLLFACLAACGSTPDTRTDAPVAAAADWQDATFEYDPTLVRVSKRGLFELDPAFIASLREQGLNNVHAGARAAHLMALIFGADLKAFSYAGGQATTAAQTWRNKRGDCLSLTVMSYALAKALELPLQMQEVHVPVAFDRRGGIDFLNNHVNGLLRVDRPLRVGNQTLPSGDLVIDFQPQVGSRHRGQPLDEDAMYARYLNNLAVEFLAAGDNPRAYAHFRAAIGAQPGYAPAFSNLAQLYLGAGQERAAEAALRRALALDPKSDLAMGAMQRLLSAQGREAEARHYESLLLASRNSDPYYWLGLGLEKLQQQQFPEAVEALEHAQALTSGFEEVHRYLAIAYWRAGKLHKARDQVAILGTLAQGQASVAELSAKLNGRTEEPRLQ